MREIVGDLWDFYGKSGFIVCITTNGFVKKNGEAVMGRGCAKEAKLRFPGIARLLGESIKKGGNHITPLRVGLLSFPVKKGWWEDADLELIKRSAYELKNLAVVDSITRFILPRPGCGNGNLKWEEVKPLLVDLPDNVWVIRKEEEANDNT